MAHPKKRMSPVRSGNRRRQLGLTLPAVTTCASCGSKVVMHQACSICGHYKGRQVLAKELLPSKR